MTGKPHDNPPGSAHEDATPPDRPEKAPPAAAPELDASDFVLDESFFQDMPMPSREHTPRRKARSASAAAKPATAGTGSARDHRGRWVHRVTAPQPTATADFVFDERVFEDAPLPAPAPLPLFSAGRGEHEADTSNQPPVSGGFFEQTDSHGAAETPRRWRPSHGPSPRAVLLFSAAVLLIGSFIYWIVHVDLPGGFRNLLKSEPRPVTVAETKRAPAPPATMDPRSPAATAKSPGPAVKPKVPPAVARPAAKTAEKTPPVPAAKPKAPSPAAKGRSVETARSARAKALPSSIPIKNSAPAPVWVAPPVTPPITPTVTPTVAAPTNTTGSEEGWFTLAEEYLQAGDPARAEDIYARILRDGSQRGRAAHALGELYFSRGDYRRATERFRDSERLFRGEAPAVAPQ